MVMKHRILVVEDSLPLAERIRQVLEGAGYRVDLAADGREGLLRVQSEPPDLIISDLTMPEMDGYAFCQAIKSAELTKRIPFVLLDERNKPEDILWALERGADNFITKPFEDDVILSVSGGSSSTWSFARRGISRWRSPCVWAVETSASPPTSSR
jgi:CheY-like chemotaxis protein